MKKININGLPAWVEGEMNENAERVNLYFNVDSPDGKRPVARVMYNYVYSNVTRTDKSKNQGMWHVFIGGDYVGSYTYMGQAVNVIEQSWAEIVQVTKDTAQTAQEQIDEYIQTHC